MTIKDFRLFQNSNLRLADEIVAARRNRKLIVVNEVTAGGGKSILPSIYASRLIPAVIDKIAWFAPRRTLKQQGAESFEDQWARSRLGHTMRIREECNDYDPSRDTQGYISTHAALTTNSDVHRHEFERYRYALVIDENQFIADGEIGARAFAPLVERATVVILMSGTIGRHDGARLAFVRYKPDEQGRGEVIDRDSDDCYRHIRYTRQQALAEQAIIPIEFEFEDFQGSWYSDGVRRDIASFDDVERGEASKAVRAALQTPYAIKLLDHCVDRWRGYRLDHPRAQLIVTAHSQAAARTYVTHLKKRFGLNAGLAVSDEGDAALAVIQRFRSRVLNPAKREHDTDVLVTVGMAYVGMDAPSAAFIACLSDYRSRAFLEQLFARATRVDRKAGPWSDQRAYIYVPDDPIMRIVVDEIRAEQDSVIKQEGPPGPPPPPRTPTIVVPIAGDMSASRAMELDGDSLAREVTMHHQQVIDQHGMTGRISPLLLDKMFKAAQATPIPDLDALRWEPPTQTVAQEEKTLRDSIEQTCLSIDRQRGAPFGTTNGEMIRAFKKSRRIMNLSELKTAQRWADQKKRDVFQ